MARNEKEQNTAPERSETGEAAAAEVDLPAENAEADVVSPAVAEEVPAADAAASAPEQEQTEDSKDNTGNTGSEAQATEDDMTAAKEAAESVTSEETAEAEITEKAGDEQAAPEVTVQAPKKSTEEQAPTGAKAALFDVLDTCESVLIAMFAVLLIFTYLFSVAVVEGDSMLPTLHDADRLLLLNFAKPETGDIVVLSSDLAYTFDENGALQSDNGLGKRIVKRLIATENQTVNIDFAAGIVYVDGTPLSEPYTSTLTTRDEGAFTYPITVPEGFVFVLGDNRSISKDSRHPDVALIPEDDIVGKVWLRVYPFDDFMAVD